MPQEAKSSQERRQYLRLDTVFPVQFRLESIDGKHFLSGWLQGFTNNISKGGICLAVNDLDPGLAKLLNDKQARLSLEIDLPIVKKPVSAIAKIAWISAPSASYNKYLIGLSYESIDAAQNKKIMRYAWTRKVFIPVGLCIIILLGSGLIINSLINAKLIKGNKALIEELAAVIQDSSVAKQKIMEIASDKEGLKTKIQDLENRIHTADKERHKVQEVAAAELTKGSEKIGELNNLIQKLKMEKEYLQKTLLTVQDKESTAAVELIRLDKRKATLEKSNFDKMYRWLTVHQNQRTGLTMSFEGDNDMANWAFIYDQSLVIQAHVYFSDLDRARKILDFFDRAAKRQKGLFFNAYYANGGEPAEYVINSGPNIWLGIAILHYTHKAEDDTYLGLAEEIAAAIMKLQNGDGEGGIRGGPSLQWYSTEHNLDAYAFFGMLYKLTGKPAYAESRDKVLNWLIKHTYDKGDIPVLRGKGDSTIATDTYAWSVSAIGPKKLEEIGMNPDKIMEFVEQACSIQVSYNRPGGQGVVFRGFDFAPQRHLARGGVVSSEWTSQMVISYKIMADYYRKKGMNAKADVYASKANEYLSGIGNMIVSSPSPSGQGEGCLPYATQDFVDTGHGWITPKGNSTGSVSGTVYALFAYYNYNPLELKD